MAMDGLLVLVCASAVVTAGPAFSAPPAAGEDRDSALTTTLAVQTAMQQGREHLLHGDYRAAVLALESQLPYINGNQAYLKLLLEAYRRHVQELRLKKQEAEADRYLRRLYILDRGAILDKGVTGADSPAAPAAPATKQAAPAPTKPPATVRLKSDDEDPFQERQALAKPNNAANQLLARAEEEFRKQHFQEARLLYDQAHALDPAVTLSCRERWAYCKLSGVVDQLNHPDVAKANWSELEREIRLALELAPRLEYGKYLLSEVQTRRAATPVSGESRRDQAVAVQHLPGRSDGWLLAESANFRIFHNQPPEFAERVAQVAERTRVDMQQRWFGATGEAWSPKCDLFLYATAQDYGRATGQSNSPGHSYLKMDSGRPVVRRIYLHCDDVNLLTAILPHETTHVVLAGQFGDQMPPRWADEGMAVLAEPRARIQCHLENLVKCRQEGQFFRIQELLQFQEQYPSDPRTIRVFYAESVALVEFLINQRGPQTFTQFLHDGMRYGYEKALERNYGYHGFAELEQRWSQHAFRERGSLAGITERSR